MWLGTAFSATVDKMLSPVTAYFGDDPNGLEHDNHLLVDTMACFHPPEDFQAKWETQSCPDYVETNFYETVETLAGADAPAGDAVVLKVARGICIQDPDEAFEPDEAMACAHLLRVRTFIEQQDELLKTVEYKRCMTFFEMHNFRVDQTVYWAHRDASYGQEGVVVEALSSLEAVCDF